MCNFKRIIPLILILAFLSLIFICPTPTLSSSEQAIYIIPVNGTIDLGLSAFIKRSVEEAKEQKPLAVVFEIDTLGGRVDAADEMVMAISNLSPIPTYAFITNSAWSAGALIAISCKTIIMKTGSSIGSAEPRMMSFMPEQQASDEKIISALRAKFKATAESNNHSPLLAEAMVDKDIELFQVEIQKVIKLLTKEELTEIKSKSSKKDLMREKVISAKGKLLNLTAQEALDIKLSAKTVSSKDEFLEYLNKQLSALKPNLISPTPIWSENLVRVITHPIISSLLLSLGFLGLMFELRMPGWGISGSLGVLFLTLFFWGHYLVGLANWLDIIIFGLGMLLLLFELFVTPGFGIFGATGIVLMATGLILTMVKHPFNLPSFELTSALHTLAYALIITFIMLVLGFKFIPHTTLWKKITLETEEKKNLGYQTNSLPTNISVGKIGLSKTILRPAGRATFNKQVLDVTTCGDFIDKDKKVCIVKIEGNKIFVEEKKEA